MAGTMQAQVKWVEGMRFAGNAGSGHGVSFESIACDGHVSPSPMELFLIGILGCTAIDIVSILGRMREPLAGLELAANASRAAENPKRFTAIEFVYTLRGKGLSREKAERAVALSHGTYCSALASLREDCAISSRIEIVDD
ncbi:MAG: osmC-like family protein [Acidobacteria bacterium]|jgi:putative redox protein|nr:osmC-like family protein [Acidobacteriota bacterium]